VLTPHLFCQLIGCGVGIIDFKNLTLATHGGRIGHGSEAGLRYLCNVRRSRARKQNKCGVNPKTSGAILSFVIMRKTKRARSFGALAQ